MSLLLIGRLGSSTFRPSTPTVSMSLAGSCFSSGIGTPALPSSGFEDEVEQSIGRPCRQLNGGSKRHCELTSSIVPRGTSFHHAVELECPPSLIGRLGSSTFRLSTTTVSMSLTGSCFSSESALRPFHHGIRRRGGTIYWTALPSVERQDPSDIANSPHPSSREGHHSTTRWSSSFLLSECDPVRFHAAAAACSRVQRNSVPSTQMRCMITANRRASATIAFFMPRRLAICIAQALSQDHFFERSML